jgi:hypothetical protein
MTIIRTKPLANNPNEGYEEDFDINTNAVDVRGVYIQNDTSNDANVIVSRDASNNMTFVDSFASKNLNELVTSNQHKSLLQLIHFIDEGPAEGFVTGATKTITGTAFPTEVLWKRADNTALVRRTITWTGPNPTVDEWKIYSSDGTTVLATVSDTITYSGPFETGRTRSIS